jgi:hypothetical protein
MKARNLVPARRSGRAWLAPAPPIGCRCATPRQRPHARRIRLAGSKPVTLSGNAFIPDPDKSNFWSGENDHTDQRKNQVYHRPDVIALDRLPAFLKAPQ